VFYNLASSSATIEEEKSWLEKVFTLASREKNESIDSTGIFSIIRHSRLLDKSASIDLLSEAGGDPLLELELLRRKLDTWPPKQAAAETWLLLNRNEKNEDLYEWAAWYFERQRLYEESRRLFIEAGRMGMKGSWLELQQGLALIMERKIAEGEKKFQLASQSSRKPDWRIPANLGRIEESRRSVSSALQYYQSAAALLTGSKERPQAALLQMRISRCLEALGRTGESISALEYAYELDPENINIRQAYRPQPSQTR
jgi:tetratricopeptide (TPR) repeat protein